MPSRYEYYLEINALSKELINRSFRSGDILQRN